MATRCCERCGERLGWELRGDARFCSGRCRIAAHRARRVTIPEAMRNLPRWTRRDGKRPITASGSPASSTDPTTWTTFPAVQAAKVGDGFGVMLGDGLACYDLDHCLTDGQLTPSPRAADVLRRVKPLYVETSMSGDGLHVFVEAPESPGTKQSGVEYYSRARFIAVTGHTWTGPLM